MPTARSILVQRDCDTSSLNLITPIRSSFLGIELRNISVNSYIYKFHFMSLTENVLVSNFPISSSISAYHL